VWRSSLKGGVSILALWLAACAGSGDGKPDPDDLLLGPPLPRCMTNVSPSGVEHASCFSGEPPREGWYLPLLAAEAEKPWFDGEINGIRIGPNVEGGDAFCESIGAAAQEDRAPVPFDESVGTPLSITPTYLPEGAEPLSSSATQCGGVVNYAEIEYWVPPDLSIPRWGGWIRVHRWRGDPLLGLAGPAADRAEASEVAGRPAVLFHPITEEGYGTSAIVIREDFGLTFLLADGVSMADLVTVAEGLY
jgi:hypothetical protein